jgi:hypothetical protein
MKRILFVLFVILALLALATGSVMADDDSGPVRDLAYYNGQLYEVQFPAANSSDPNQFTFGCFTLGPDFTESPAEPTGTLYAIFAEGVTLDSCPDGTVKHDHILSAVPGTPGYTPKWNVKFVNEGPNFEPSIMPITSEQELMDAVEAGQLVIENPPVTIIFNAPVVGLAE